MQGFPTPALQNGHSRFVGVPGRPVIVLDIWIQSRLSLNDFQYPDYPVDACNVVLGPTRQLVARRVRSISLDRALVEPSVLVHASSRQETRLRPAWPYFHRHPRL